MADLWMPGAERRPENNGGSMVGGPARSIWHITWDELGAGGRMPSFDAIANYLQRVNFCPHLMWDPWTGKIVQFYPADQSARAVQNLSGGVETNRMGSRCIQVEVFFSPGAVVAGKKYATVADTPCKGLDKIVAWMRSHGIPDEWPLGWPKWSGNSRNATTWRTKAGHYGHSQTPENDHTDPGPMPKAMFGAKPPSTPPKPVPTPPWPGRLLRNREPMMHGQDVLAWQKKMKARGWTITADSYYGDQSEKVCKEFQREKHLAVDGVVGRDTWIATFTAKVT